MQPFKLTTAIFNSSLLKNAQAIHAAYEPLFNEIQRQAVYSASLRNTFLTKIEELNHQKKMVNDVFQKFHPRMKADILKHSLVLDQLHRNASTSLDSFRKSMLPTQHTLTQNIAAIKTAHLAFTQEIEQSVKTITVFQTEHFQRLENLKRLTQPLPQMFAKLPSQLGMLHRQLKSLKIDKLEQLARETQNDSESIDWNSPKLGEAASAIQTELLQEPLFQTLPVELQFERLINAVENLQQPSWVKQVFLGIASAFLASVLFFFAQQMLLPYFPTPESTSRVEAVRDIHIYIQASGVENDILSDYRIVRTWVVVHKSKRRKSPITLLDPGTVVLLVQKNKKWSLIEWIDAQSKIVFHGWIRSKYLRRI